MNDVVDDAITIANSSPTLGERLGSAREEKKFTIAEVAAQLSLPRKTIIHLEEQQWDQLHGRIYARGYFSAYVKFLGLPLEEMLALFNLEYKSSHADVVYQQSNAKPVSGFIPLLLISLLVGAGWFGYQYWLQENTDMLSAEIPNASMLEPEQEQEGQDFDAFSDSVVEPLSQEEYQPAGDDLYPVLEVIEQQAGFIQQTESPIDEQVLATTSVIEDGQQQIEVEQEIDNTIEQQVDIPTIGNNLEDLKPVTLKLVFIQDCWVEVSDAQAKTLLNRTMQASETIELSGQAPLKVLLGNASAVLVKFNDVEFDTSPYIQGDVARFSLGVDS